MLVYVQNKDGKPLMPTSRCGKVRRLLKTGKAVVVEQIPFTIRLCYDTTDYVQPITLGVDTGTKHVGLSATTERMELYVSEVEIRSDIVDLISTRREARRTRRGNKTRYRKPRFNNRKIKKGWIPPSICEKVNSHFRQICSVFKILPISKIIIEFGGFDHRIEGKTETTSIGHKKHNCARFRNTRERILERDEYKCQYCKGKSKDPILNVHHIESRKTGGSSMGNLITLCETCHKRYHKGEIKLNIRRLPSSRDLAVMVRMKDRLYSKLMLICQDIFVTFGNTTKLNRVNQKIGKTHIDDAFVISGNFYAKRLNYYYKVRLTRRHNRQIHKFKIKKGNRKIKNQSAFEVMGFRLFDRVLYKRDIMFVTSKRTRGWFAIRDINYNNKIELSCKKLKLYRNKRNMIQIVKRKNEDNLDLEYDEDVVIFDFV